MNPCPAVDLHRLVSTDKRGRTPGHAITSGRGERSLRQSQLQPSDMDASQSVLSKFSATKQRIRESAEVTKTDIDELADECGAIPELLDALLELYTGIGAYDRVEQTLDRLVALDPSDAKSRLKLAKLLTDRKKTVHLKVNARDLAHQHLEKLTSSPTLTGAQWLSIANCYITSTGYDDAIAAAHRAMAELDGLPKISARFSLIEALIGVGKRDEAYREVEAASRDATLNDQQLRVALLLEKLEYHERALEITRGVVSSFASDTDPMMYLRAAKIFARQGCSEEASALLQTVGFVKFETLFTLRAFHGICFELHLNELAMSYAQAALVKSPYDKDMHEHVALLRILARHSPMPPSSQKRPRSVFGRMFHRSSAQTGTEPH